MAINIFLTVNTKNVRSNCPESGFTSNPNEFTPESNDFRPNLENPLLRPVLGLINLLIVRAINIELHLPWEGKAKRVIKRVKRLLTS